LINIDIYIYIYIYIYMIDKIFKDIILLMMRGMIFLLIISYDKFYMAIVLVCDYKLLTIL